MPARGTAGRSGSETSSFAARCDDTRGDEEDVGTDLDFSKYTRDRVDYESGGNTRDLWAAIYRRHGANQRELRSAAVKVAAAAAAEERTSVEERRPRGGTCASPAAAR